MITAKPGNTRAQAARDNRDPLLLAVINLALLALGAFLILAAPQPLPLLGRLLVAAVILEWSVLTLLEARHPAQPTARTFKTETRPR